MNTITKARNYSEVSQSLSALAPFVHTTISARWIDGTYTVFSYRTPVAWYKDGVGTLTEQRYSVTTSKHLGYVRRAWKV